MSAVAGSATKAAEGGPSAANGRAGWRPRPALLAAAAYLLLAIWVTWPLARRWSDHLFGVDPERWPGAAQLGLADHFLNLWILAWDCHALRTAPLALFDANIFYPLPQSLATGEHMLGVLPWIAPVYAITVNPVAAANALVFLSFVIGGLGMYYLVLDLTERHGAAFVAGIVFAFAPWRFSWLVHLQLVGVHLFPFTVLWLRRFLDRGSRIALLAFAIALTLQALTSYYLAYMCAVLCAGVLFWLPGHGTARTTWARWTSVIIAGSLAALTVGFLSLPYVHQAAAGIVPSGAEAHREPWLQIASAQPREFLTRGSPQYAGAIPMVLALLGLWPYRGHTRTQLLLLWALVAGAALSLGPRLGGWTLPYAWLTAWVPGFSTLRVPERFIILATVGLAGLGGVGAARVQSLVAQARRSRPARMAGVLTLGVMLGTLWLDWIPPRMRLVLVRFPRLAEAPEAYRWLAAHGEGAPLLEVPAGERGLPGAAMRARAQYFSIVHWLPLLSGYNGYHPPLVDLYADLARRLPERVALQSLANIVDVKWILVHKETLEPVPREQWLEPTSGLEQVERFGDDLLFRVTLPPNHDWRSHLRSREPEAVTFAGLPIVAVPSHGRDAVLEASIPRGHAQASAPVRISVRLTNPTPVHWPCFAARTTGLVGLRVRWLAPDGDAVGKPTVARIPRDLGPGEQASFSAWTRAPRAAGRYTLELAVGQGAAYDPEAWRAGKTALQIEVHREGEEGE